MISVCRSALEIIQKGFVNFRTYLHRYMENNKKETIITITITITITIFITI